MTICWKVEGGGDDKKMFIFVTVNKKAKNKLS